MSVPYLKEAAAAGETKKLIRFVRLHLGDGNEEAGRKEIDKSRMEALRGRAASLARSLTA